MSEIKRKLGVAPGKVMLFGEYAVLEARHALLCPTPHIAEARYAPLPASSLSASSLSASSLSASTSSRLIRSHPQHFEAIIQLYSEVARLEAQLLYMIIAHPLGVGGVAQRGEDRLTLGLPLPFAMTALTSLSAPAGIYLIDTSRFGERREDGWEKMGVGSSGAATTALIDLVDQLTEAIDLNNESGEGTPEQDVTQSRFERACEIHYTAQGKLGSGADIAVSAYRCPLRYLGPPHREVQPLSSSQGLISWPLTWGIWAGGSASTSDAVRRVKAWATLAPSVYDRLIEEISEAEQMAHQALHLPDPQAVWCEAFTRGGDAVRALGEHAQVPIWTPRHQAWSARVNPLGGVIKPSGAGGDDLSLFTARTLEDGVRALDALRDEAAERGERLKVFRLDVSLTDS